MALTEKEFSMIKKKINKIDLRLNELYKNWHVEYENANTLEECEEIKNFYKPYLEKYESKYRVLYHLLQQPGLIPTHDSASDITPSLAALDDATSLKQKEWICSEPGEDTPCQYSSIQGSLTPHTPRSEVMRLEPFLNVTPEGTSSETTYMEIPNTHAKTIHKSPTSEVPKSLQGTKEASRAEALVSTWQLFAAVDRRNVNVPARNQLTSVEAHGRDNIEVPDILTTTVATTVASTTTPPITVDVELRGTSILELVYLKGPHHAPLLLQNVDQEHGCNNLLRDKQMNLEGKILVQVKVIHL